MRYELENRYSFTVLQFWKKKHPRGEQSQDKIEKFWIVQVKIHQKKTLSSRREFSLVS